MVPAALVCSYVTMLELYSAQAARESSTLARLSEAKGAIIYPQVPFLVAFLHFIQFGGLALAALPLGGCDARGGKFLSDSCRFERLLHATAVPGVPGFYLLDRVVFWAAYTASLVMLLGFGFLTISQYRRYGNCSGCIPVASPRGENYDCTPSAEQNRKALLSLDGVLLNQQQFRSSYSLCASLPVWWLAAAVGIRCAALCLQLPQRSRHSTHQEYITPQKI